MGEDEIRDGAADLRREPEPGGDGIRKGIAQDGRGVVVHGFGVGVRTSDLEAVAHPLLDIKLNRLTSGAGRVLRWSDPRMHSVDRWAECQASRRAAVAVPRSRIGGVSNL